MKTIIILGDGMADHPIARLGGRTPLQASTTPYMDLLARQGRQGRLVTVPEGFAPGSEVANTAILGYDLNKVYEGRGPLEAASIGYEMDVADMAIRCNLITLQDGRILTHNGGNLDTENGRMLMEYLDGQIGTPDVKFIGGIAYRHLLVIRRGSKHIVCAPPHDHPNEEWQPLLVKSEPGWENRREAIVGLDGKPTGEERMTGNETAQLLNSLILRSQELLAAHPYNQAKTAKGERPANSIWLWSGGYRPSMQTIAAQYPQVRSGSVISAVDLMKGIGHYAGLDIVEVPGATGLTDTNYEGKVSAALDALRRQDFVYLHLEATDEAGHDGDLTLKERAIEYLDYRVVAPIYNEVKRWDEPVCIALLPDHPTPVEIRTHVSEPVPFVVWYPGITPDATQTYDEVAAVSGAFGMLRLQEFMQMLMNIK